MKLKKERWNPSKNLEAPLHWTRKPREIEFVVGHLPFLSGDIDSVDEIFSIVLACLILDNIPDHKFVWRPEAQVVRVFQDYIRFPSTLVKRLAKVGDRFITVGDGNTLYSELVHGHTCYDWDQDGRNSSGSEFKEWGYVNRFVPFPNLQILS